MTEKNPNTNESDVKKEEYDINNPYPEYERKVKNYKASAKEIVKDEKTGIETGYSESGRVIYTLDSEGKMTLYWDKEGKKPREEWCPNGDQIGYMKNGQIDYKTDSQDNLTYYADEKPVCTTDKRNNETHYRDDGKTIDYVVASNGIITQYKEDGKTIDYTEEHVYENGKCVGSVTYRPDGSLRSVISPDGKDEVFYKKDGITKDYAFHNGVAIMYDEKGKAEAGAFINDKGKLKIVEKSDKAATMTAMKKSETEKKEASSKISESKKEKKKDKKAAKKAKKESVKADKETKKEDTPESGRAQEIKLIDSLIASFGKKGR